MMLYSIFFAIFLNRSMFVIIETIERDDLKWNQEIQIFSMGGSRIFVETD